MFNLNGLQPAAVTNIALCFGLTITVLVYCFAGTHLLPTEALGPLRLPIFSSHPFRHLRGQHQPGRDVGAGDYAQDVRISRRLLCAG